jgi:hypothetical protein
MRPLIISALAATLIGCTWFAPQQAQQASLYSITDAPLADSNTGEAEKAIHAETICPPHRKKPASGTKITKVSAQKMNASSRVQSEDKSRTSNNAQSTVATRTDTQQTAQPVDKSGTSINAQSTVAARTDTQQTAQPVDKSDHVFNKAISAIAAKMQNSASVELVEMKRAEKIASGKSIDTICGYVREKETLGADNGGKSFLYLVQEDEAYIDGYNLATSPYHNLCTQNASGLLEFLL